MGVVAPAVPTLHMNRERLEEEAMAVLNVVVFALVVAMPIWFLAHWLHHGIVYWLWGPILGTGVAYVFSWEEDTPYPVPPGTRRTWLRAVGMGAVHLVTVTALWVLIDKYSFVDLVNM